MNTEEMGLPDEMQCPWCESEISIRMKICPHCETMLH
jgi:primosomal protein N'